MRRPRRIFCAHETRRGRRVYVCRSAPALEHSNLTRRQARPNHTAHMIDKLMRVCIICRMHTDQKRLETQIKQVQVAMIGCLRDTNLTKLLPNNKHLLGIFQSNHITIYGF